MIKIILVPNYPLENNFWKTELTLRRPKQHRSQAPDVSDLAQTVPGYIYLLVNWLEALAEIRRFDVIFSEALLVKAS